MHTSETDSARQLLESELAADTEPGALRRVFAAFPSGVTAVAALVDGQPVGLAASSFTSVSVHPPLVSVCVAHTSTTWPTLARSVRFGLSVLGADQADLCRQLSARDADRFAAVSWRATPSGAVLIDGASAWFDCSIDHLLRAGDHDIVLLRVNGHRLHSEVPPLVFHASQFRVLHI